MSIEKLKDPFPPERVHWRIGKVTKDGKKALALGYIDARDVMDRLDEVVGPMGWCDTYSFNGARTMCRLAIVQVDQHMNYEWITKEDGAGDTDFEGEKGGISDAFKRAAVKWGVGRYLYNIPNTWVEIEGEGKFAKIKPSELKRLAALLPSDQKQPAKKASKKAPSGESERTSDAPLGWTPEQIKAATDKMDLAYEKGFLPECWAELNLTFKTATVDQITALTAYKDDLKKTYKENKDEPGD